MTEAVFALLPVCLLHFGYAKEINKELKMKITVDLSNEIYERLLRLAQSKGVSVSEIAAQLLEEAEANRRAAVVEQMRAEGILLPKKPLPPGPERVYKRIDVQGKLLSETIIEERR